MPISNFTINHESVQRQVRVDQYTIKKDSGDASIHVFAHHRPVIANDRMMKADRPAKLVEADFSQAEIVTAAKAIADTNGITITMAQLGQILLGLPEQLIRAKFED